MTTIVEMRVHMDCHGCESKVKKALSKLDGVDNIDIDMDMQKVTVTGWADAKKVLKAVRRAGRNAELWPFPYNPEYHEYNHQYYNYYGSPVNSPITDDFLAEPPSMYNYYEHGYNGHNHGYYQQPPSSIILDEGASTMFSDDNATGCSIM
ncbi:heavy metal-associated isoprenylated plant protein 29-like [Primulina huaijiensis]|uniref:heavy metal-associated isoprenylated plant protein 29-like n=1 Tax=Primulina huaijiensis TaxID=1492673 RepID=UPI003CC73682